MVELLRWGGRDFGLGEWNYLFHGEGRDLARDLPCQRSIEYLDLVVYEGGGEVQVR